MLKTLVEKARLLHRLDPWSWQPRPRPFAIRLPGMAEPVFVHFDTVTMAGGKVVPTVALVFGFRSEFIRSFIAHAKSSNEETSSGYLSTRDVEIENARIFLQRAEDHPREIEALYRNAGIELQPGDIAPIIARNHVGFVPTAVPSPRDCQTYATIINEAIGILLRSEDDPRMLVPPSAQSVMQRTVAPDANKAAEAFIALPPVPDFMPSQISMPPDELIAKANDLPVKYKRVEISIQPSFPMSLVLAKKSSASPASQIPLSYLFAVLDASDGKQPDGISSIANAAVAPAGDLASLYNNFNANLLRTFIGAGGRPAQIVVSSPLLTLFLRQLQTRMQFKLTYFHKLPFYDAFLQRVNRGMEAVILKKAPGNGNADTPSAQA